MGKYLDKIRGRDPGGCVPSIETRPADPSPTLHAGSLVTWMRGDGCKQEGFVDCIHTDDTGTRWALVGLPCGTWVAVQLKLLKGPNA